MTEENREHRRAGPRALRWQSQAVLLAIVPVAAIWVTLQGGTERYARPTVVWSAAVISVVLAALVHLTRAATLGAAITGAIFTAAFYLQTPGFHTVLWPLLALLVLTFGATRFGRHRKEALGVAEARRGRTASQVAANLGIAALAGIPQIMGQFSDLFFLSPRFTLVPMLAAMAEATADTVSSELGQVLGGEPRLITNFRRVPAGTDGAVSVAGTLCGCVGAAVVVLVGLAVLPVNRRDGLIAFGAGIAGTLLDSVLGALPERRGWLNNDAVNALSTLSAAALAACVLRWA